MNSTQNKAKYNLLLKTISSRNWKIAQENEQPRETEAFRGGEVATTAVPTTTARGVHHGQAMVARLHRFLNAAFCACLEPRVLPWIVHIYSAFWACFTNCLDFAWLNLMLFS